jgi:hypothetical protein
VLKYINALDQDAAVREAHAANPASAMAQYGLGLADQVSDIVWK